MERQRTYFYGFVVGAVLMTIPIPYFFFWEDVLDNVEILFDYGGFILFVICGIPLVVEVFRNLFKR